MRRGPTSRFFFGIWALDLRGRRSTGSTTLGIMNPGTAGGPLLPNKFETAPSAIKPLLPWRERLGLNMARSITTLSLWDGVSSILLPGSCMTLLQERGQ